MLANIRTDIVWVAAGSWHTVGVKYDCTVVALGMNDYGQCDVARWNLISQDGAADWTIVFIETVRL